MSSLLRTLISLAFLAGALWFSFAVELGDRTLAQHIDRIGQTPEARELVEGTRSTVNPMLQEATDRMLGEHIEAPIRADPDDKRAGATHTATTDRLRPSTADEHRLPGRR